jgi:hypothetical protein
MENLQDLSFAVGAAGTPVLLNVPNLPPQIASPILKMTPLHEMGGHESEQIRSCSQ